MKFIVCLIAVLFQAAAWADSPPPILSPRVKGTTNEVNILPAGRLAGAVDADHSNNSQNRTKEKVPDMKDVTNGILAANQSKATVCPYLVYSNLYSSTGDWGGGTSSFESFFYNYQCRIRQCGTINSFKIITDSIKTCESFTIRIWRHISGDSFILVGESEDVISQLKPHCTNSIILKTPIEGVQEGDYYGYRQTLSGKPCLMPSVHTLTTGKGYFLVDQAKAATGTNWLNMAGYVRFVPIWLEMQSPEIIAIGDSITQGAPHNHAFTQELGLTYNPSTYWMAKVATTLGCHFQNMGHGSDTMPEISRRLTNDVLAAKPRLVIMEGGINDILHGSSSAQIIQCWTNIIATVASNNILPVVLAILPCNGANTAQMQTRDAVNAALASYVPSVGGLFVSGIDSALGQFRAGGDAGNLWDFKTGYNSDQWHLTPVASKALADLIVSQLKSWPRYLESVPKSTTPHAESVSP